MMITTAMLIGLAWKSALIAGLTLALLRLARTRSAGERSLVAHVGLLALLTLPIATLVLPQWQPLPASWVAPAEPAIAANEIANTGASAVDPVAATASVPVVADMAGSPLMILSGVTDLAPFLYAVPLFLLFGVMLLAVLRLFAMRGRAEILVERSWLSALAEAQRRMGFKHGTALLVSDELRSPISWGLLRSTIVLSPKAVQAVGEAEAIIAHELAHIARLDWAKLLASRVACAVFWFNPLVWMLARESHQLREEAADDAVLMADIDGPDYATLLVGAARHDNKAALMAAHGVAPSHGSLKRRITRVLDASLKRGPASASWVLMSLVVLAGVTAPLAAFSATAAEEQATAARTVAVDSRTVAVAARQSALVSSQSALASHDVAEDRAAQAAARSKQLTAEELVSMRAVGVTPEYIAKIREHDDTMTADEIIGAKVTGVDPSYIKTMRSIFPGVSVDDLIGASALHIEPAFARDMKTHFPDIGIDDVVALRAMGIDCDFVTDMRKAGVRIRSPEDAIELRATGMAQRGPSRKFSATSRSGASASIGPGNVMEARSADGRVARIELPESPESARPAQPARPAKPPAG